MSTIAPPQKPAHRQFVTQRDPAVLEKLGVVTPAEAQTLKRADAIVAGNHDGLVQLSEVERITASDVWKTLHPPEQSALQGVWSWFELGDPKAQEVVHPPVSVREEPGAIGAFDPATAVQIATLPADLQAVATRVQLSLDPDGDPRSLQYADVLKALDSSSSYTAPEVEQLRTLKQHFQEKVLVRTVVPPRLVVQGRLGPHQTSIVSTPDLKASVITEAELGLRQSKHGDQLALVTYPAEVVLEVPPGSRMLVTNGSGENILGSGTHRLSAASGRWLVECFGSDGKKRVDAAFEVPPERELGKLPQSVGLEVVDSQGQKYERQLEALDYDFADWTYVPQGTAQHKGNARVAALRFATAPSSLKDGKYRIFALGPGSTSPTPTPRYGTWLTLEKFPGDIYYVSLRDQPTRYRLFPVPKDGIEDREVLKATPPEQVRHDHESITFDTRTNRLTRSYWFNYSGIYLDEVATVTSAAAVSG